MNTIQTCSAFSFKQLQLLPSVYPYVSALVFYNKVSDSLCYIFAATKICDVLLWTTAPVFFLSLFHRR